MKIVVTYTILHVILIPFQFSYRGSDRRYYQFLHREVEEDNQKRISTNSRFALLAKLGRRKSS